MRWYKKLVVTCLVEYIPSTDIQGMHELDDHLPSRFSLSSHLRRLQPNCTGLYHMTCNWTHHTKMAHTILSRVNTVSETSFQSVTQTNNGNWSADFVWLVENNFQNADLLNIAFYLFYFTLSRSLPKSAVHSADLISRSLSPLSDISFENNQISSENRGLFSRSICLR